jgi:acyl-CoA synthetase (AMP-forming)/AMP-acid ligase II
VATVVHTMGEDGDPRGAVLTHGNVVHSALAATDAIPITTDDVMLSVLPLSHMFERGCGVLATLAAGATVVFADRSVERWVADRPVSRRSCASSFFLRTWARHPRGSRQPAWTGAVAVGPRARAGAEECVAAGREAALLPVRGAPLDSTARF